MHGFPGRPFTGDERGGFISVGAVCQRLRFGGGWSVLRRWAAGRVDSSLRSHRTWRSYCRHVCSGLNKTLYASVGPNSRCRSHRQTLPAEPESPGIAATFIAFLQGCCLSGRMNPSRGHRRDATRSLAWRAEKLPPHPFKRNSSLGGLLRRMSFTSCSGLIQTRGAIDRLLAAIRFLIPHNGVQRAEQPASHRHVGFGLADPPDQSLPNGLLPGVTLTERDGCLAEGPAERGRAGLGDVAALRATGRFLEV